MAINAVESRNSLIPRNGEPRSGHLDSYSDSKKISKKARFNEETAQGCLQNSLKIQPVGYRRVSSILPCFGRGRRHRKLAAFQNANHTRT